ncbi:hypothetical protein GF395_00425 [Candidatus Uhrbacteria bacterium]|nr:hypothetical protein [Candidatus Uhrbacteria bacterium]
MTHCIARGQLVYPKGCSLSQKSALSEQTKKQLRELVYLEVPCAFECDEELEWILWDAMDYAFAEQGQDLSTPELRMIAMILDVLRDNEDEAELGRIYTLQHLYFKQRRGVELLELEPVAEYKRRSTMHYLMMRNALGVLALAWHVITDPNIQLSPDALITQLHAKHPSH